MNARPELPAVETAGVLEIESPLPPGKRVLFFLLSLFPLLAPYELLWKPRWTGYANAFFLFAAAISLGALALSLLLVFAALAGHASRMRFDRPRGLFTYTTRAPLPGTRSFERPLSALAGVEVVTHEWSEGAPSHSLKVVARDGTAFTTSSSWSREEVEALRAKVAAYLAA